MVAPGADRLTDVCSPACRQQLTADFRPLWNDLGRDLTAGELADRLADATVLVSSWGTPPLTEAMLERAPSLRAVCHAAGTVKRLVPRAAFDRGIAVFSAGDRLAQSVGEYCLAATLTLLRRLSSYERQMRAGEWRPGGTRGEELFGRTVGLVAASSTARWFLRLLGPFGVDAVVYDPYLSAESAARLGVRLGSLDEVMRCDIVSVHAPVTPETDGLVTRQLLASMRDGAVFLNSARGSVVDGTALFAELRTGRILGAVDVFDLEPPALDPALREAPNVLLTPHIAGNTVQGHQALMETVVRDAARWLADGTRGATQVDVRAWEISA